MNLRITRFVFHYSLFHAAMNNHFICHDKNLLKAEKVSFFKNILIPFRELNFLAVNVYLKWRAEFISSTAVPSVSYCTRPYNQIKQLLISSWRLTVYSLPSPGLKEPFKGQNSKFGKGRSTFTNLKYNIYFFYLLVAQMCTRIFACIYMHD